MRCGRDSSDWICTDPNNTAHYAILKKSGLRGDAWKRLKGKRQERKCGRTEFGEIIFQIKTITVSVCLDSVSQYSKEISRKVMMVCLINCVTSGGKLDILTELMCFV